MADIVVERLLHHATHAPVPYTSVWQARMHSRQ